MDRRGGNPFRGQPLSGQYDWGYREYDAKCWASFYGIPFREPIAFRVDPDRLALACLAADGQGALVPCCRLLQQLIFVEGVAVDDGVIAGLAGRLELDKARLPSVTSPPRRRARGTTALLDGEQPNAARSACRPSSSGSRCSGATIALCCSRQHSAEGMPAIQQ